MIAKQLPMNQILRIEKVKSTITLLNLKVLVSFLEILPDYWSAHLGIYLKAHV